LLKLDLTAKGKKMAIFFENFSLKAVLVFTAVKRQRALLQNTLTALENSSLYGFLT
jgi:hypothetical protein